MTCLHQPCSEVVAPHRPCEDMLTTHYGSWLGLAHHTVFVQSRVKNANRRSGGIQVG